MAAELDEMTQYDWFARARVHETTGETRKAIEAYDESLKIDPKFAKAWFYKGKLHYKLGEIDQAKECVKHTLEIKPEWENHVRKYMPEL